MLSIDNLSVTFTQYDRGLRRKQLTVITDLNLDVAAGEVVAVVGASGSGKSLLAHALLGILPENASVRGTMRFHNEPLTPRRCRALRGKKIVLIPQSVGYLDPLMRVGPQVQRVAQISDQLSGQLLGQLSGQLSGQSKAAARTTAEKTFSRYDLPSKTFGLYPFQLSGGMARRVLVSTAVVTPAQLVIADEPTPGLHPDVAAETLAHLRELADEGRGVILITHDIAAALQIADRVAVFYAGTTVEIAAARDFFTGSASDSSLGSSSGSSSSSSVGNLRHPYTQALWRSLPQNEFLPVPGNQPSPEHLPSGCLFSDRCSWASELCLQERPALRKLKGGWVRCVHAEG